MNYTLWIIIGVGIIVFSFLGRVIFTNFIAPIPGTAVRFGKAWGKTTDRYIFLRALNSFFYIIGMAVTLVGVTYAIGMLFRSDPPPVSVAVQPIQDEKLEAKTVLQLVNVERKHRGLSELESDPQLTAIAEARAKDMIDNQYYAHVNLMGKSFDKLFQDLGLKSDYSCENLDIGFTTDEKQYISDWLASTKGHYECLLNTKTTAAGYAAVLFGETANDKIYLVVGIHSTPLKPL